MYKWIITLSVLSVFLVSVSCSNNSNEAKKMKFTGKDGEVKLMTLDPGHFHAALVQKFMNKQVSPEVYVFAPGGPDVQDHLQRIEGFNSREENPTHWKEIVYTGDDFLTKMRERHQRNICKKEMQRIFGDKLNFLLVKDEYDKYLFYEEVLKKINKISYQARAAKTKQLKKIVEEMADKLGIEKETIEGYKDYILSGCRDMFGESTNERKDDT